MSDISPLLQSAENVTDEVVNENRQNVQIDKQESTDKEKIKSTPIRWYVLTVYCFLGFLQNLIWNTWGPIAASSELVFGLNDGTIALMTSWGSIAYVISAFFFSWLMDVKGLRISCITVSILVFTGASIRCGAIIRPSATWFIHSGQLLNGLGGPVIGAAPPLLSVLWFPINERITATAISTCISITGTAVSFVLGPYIVPDVNITICANETSLNFKFWILAIPYGTTLGVFACWSALLDVNLKPLNITQETAGWIGFGSTMAGQVSAIGIGIFADIIRRRKKTAVIIRTLYITAFIVFLIITLERAKILITHDVVLWLVIMVVLGSSCVYALAPLMYELGCETTYPVSEGVTNMAMTILVNIAALTFLLIMMIPNIGVIWINWCLVAIVGCCIPVFIFTKIRYSRIDIDTAIEKDGNGSST